MLEVDRCWFEGFDSAIEVAANFRTDVHIAETMIVRSPARDPAAAHAAKVMAGV